MVNMTLVVGKKDILRYGIKAFAFILILFVFSKVINIETTKIEISNSLNFIGKEKLLECIEENFAVVKEINIKEASGGEMNEINPLKIALNSQIPILNGITKKEELSENEIKETEKKEENIEQAETEVTTEVVENNVPENYTNSYNDVFIKNGTDYGLTEDILNPDIEIKK